MYLKKSTMVPSIALAGAVAVALSLGTIGAAQAGDDGKASMEKCYGVAKAGKNDCASGANSCAGTSTKDGDPGAFVAVPKGLCAKLASGSLTPKS